MTIRVRVSTLDLYRSFLSDEDFTYDVFCRQLMGEEEATEHMQRGTAFAKAMEHVELGEQSTISANGHVFAFTCDAEVESWPRREQRMEKDYGGIIVTGRCDRIMGRVIADDKTTSSQFDAEKYLDKRQYAYYLDIFDADEFRWHIWVCKKLEDEHSPNDSTAWEVYQHHLLKQYRYPGMEEDNAALAHEFRDFAERIGYNGVGDKIP